LKTTWIVIVAAVLGLAPSTAHHAVRVRYADLPRPMQSRLAAEGIDEGSFEKYVAAAEAETSRRVAEGDREHLIYYALQSGRFTRRARIEPALSARRFVDGLPSSERDRFLAEPEFQPASGLPPEERSRLTDLLSALRKSAAEVAPRRAGRRAALAAAGESHDPRLEYFRDLVQSIGQPSSPDVFYPDYLRVARFLYKKEFVAPRDAAEVARLYQTRSHSSDTQIDAGFGVYIGLGVIHALEPAFRARRVLVVGPGLDLAPRTDLIDVADLQSYQPLAVADALLSLSLASADDLRVHSVDVNPRVVRAVEQLARDGVTWHLFSGLTETPERMLSAEYREYLERLGRAIGDEIKAPRQVASNRQHQHSIGVRATAAKTFSAQSLNVITERLTDASFDVIIVTNVLPYFDDRELMLALANLSAMLRAGGYLLHNEARDGLADLSGAAGIPAIQMRTAILGGPAARPLYDIVWIHQRPLGG